MRSPSRAILGRGCRPEQTVEHAADSVAGTIGVKLGTVRLDSFSRTRGKHLLSADCVLRPRWAQTQCTRVLALKKLLLQLCSLAGPQALSDSPFIVSYELSWMEYGFNFLSKCTECWYL